MTKKDKREPLWFRVAIPAKPLRSQRSANGKEPARGGYPSPVYDLNAIELEVPCFPLRFTPEENQALLDGRKPNNNE